MLVDIPVHTDPLVNPNVWRRGKKERFCGPNLSEDKQTLDFALFAE